MNVLVCLAAILFILMILIGGKKGARSFIALFFNFAVLLITIIIMTILKANPIILTLIACTVISCINLFYINEVNTKTKTAFLSSMMTIVLLLFFIVIVTDHAIIQGFGEEETEELSIFSLYIGVDFVKIGAFCDHYEYNRRHHKSAIAISSPMHEMFRHHPFISRKDLFTFGLNIGKDILGTIANTLFFTFFGGYMALLIWFKDLSYSLEEVVNSKIFSAEMITIFSAGIGVALIIPITSWITAYFFVKTKEKNETVE